MSDAHEGHEIHWTEQFREWLGELDADRYGQAMFVRITETKLEEVWNSNSIKDIKAVFCTTRNLYRITAKASYLGCIATSRVARAGETTLRGNDLPDGAFSEDTWRKIKDAILRYELVQLEPVSEPAQEMEAPAQSGAEASAEESPEA